MCYLSCIRGRGSNLKIWMLALVSTALTSMPAYAQDYAKESWHNWQWQINTGILQQDYQEIDANHLTTDGILNQETGNLPQISVSVTNSLDNQPTTNNWIPYGTFSLDYSKGSTDYNGYLQAGNHLTPYQTQTDNTIINGTLAFGATKALNNNLQLSPNIAVNHYQWQRQLEQYTEDFRHTAMLAGVAIDWQPSDTQPINLQATAQLGKLLDSEIDVPKLGLKQDIGKSNIWQVGINASYQLSNNVSLNAGVNHKKWQYQQSKIENDYQYPDSDNKQTTWSVGLGYGF